MKHERRLTFADLIAPLTPDAFFQDVWEQRPLVQHCPTGEAFATLLSWEAADQLIYGAALQHRAVRLFRDGDWLPQELYVAPTPPPSAASDGIPVVAADPPRVFEQFRRGASIHVRDLQRSHPPIARFCRQLEEALGFPVGAAAFLSPPNVDPRRGEPRFAIHYDEEDQFVLQVSGSKRWRIYDAPYPLPLGDQSSEAMGVVPGECLHELALRAGDVIYLPRGFLHEAVTQDEPSLHLVFFVRTVRWLAALRAALDSLSGDIRFRRSIPVRAVTGEGMAEFSQQFECMARLAAEQMSADAAVTHLRRELLRSHRPVLDGHFVDLLHLDQVRATTVVRRRPGSSVEVGPDGQLKLRLGHKTLSHSSFDPASLRYITSHDVFRVGEIPGPPDDRDKVVLAKLLIRAGVLELTNRASDAGASGDV